MIENTYKELELDKTKQNRKITRTTKERRTRNFKKKKLKKLKTAIEYFDEIILSEIPSRYVLEKCNR